MKKVLAVSCIPVLVVLAAWGLHALRGGPADAPKDDDGVRCVVLDAGHGGKDPGAMVGDISEKDITLAITLLVREQLEQAQGDLTVSMTREEDTYPTLTERAEHANEAGADLFVSIHVNALDNNTDYAGILTFYHPGKGSSKAPARQIQDAVTTATGGIDRGIRSEDYAVLRETDMPAVLVETGFMTCPEELEDLLDPAYQEKLAQGITQGILQYFDL